MKDLGVLVSHGGIPDLSPVEGADFEWWFLQGWVEGPGIARQYVMATVFQIGGVGPAAPRGAMMIQHVLEPDAGSSWVDSRVTPGVMTAYRSVAEKYAERLPLPVRAAGLRRHMRDTETWARVSGIAIDPAGPRISAAPFSVSWNGVSLSSHETGLEFAMTARNQTRLRLDLAAQTRWLNERSTGINPALPDHFHYVSCPRLSAKGELGGVPVSGQFWFDRQWGSYNDWILKGDTGQSRVQGWHWFGLNLDDGRDLMLFHELDSGAPEPRFATGVLYENGVPRSIDWRPVRIRQHWRSPQSFARYPVEWDIELPDLGLTAQIVPIATDQEIPVYGSTAIWEGAVTVHGKERGREIGGLGRLELVGFGTPLSLQDHARRSLGKFARNLGGAFGFASR